MSALSKTDMGPQPRKNGTDRKRPCYAKRKKDFFFFSSVFLQVALSLPLATFVIAQQTLIGSPISPFLSLVAFLLSWSGSVLFIHLISVS
jgi:hypothetical protein